MWFMGAIHYNIIGLYNNNKKSRNKHQRKTLNLTPTLNPNPNPRFYQVKLENYGTNVTPGKNSSRKLYIYMYILAPIIWKTRNMLEVINRTITI